MKRDRNEYPLKERIAWKARRKHRHFKYWALKKLFPQVAERNSILMGNAGYDDDEYVFTKFQEEIEISKAEHDKFLKTDEYMKLALLRNMEKRISKYVEVSEVYDLDIDKYIIIGELVIVRKN